MMKWHLILVVSFACAHAQNFSCGYKDEDLMSQIGLTRKDGKLRVSYKIDNFDKNSEEAIHEVMEDIERHTCLKFEKRKKSKRKLGKSKTKGRPYLRIEAKNARSCKKADLDYQVYLGDVSEYEYASGKINLRMSTWICKELYNIWKGAFLHQMFHVFGIMHTQKRSDRDDYIEVITKNIKDSEDSQQKYEICEHCPLPPTSFECNSLMHFQNGQDGKQELYLDDDDDFDNKQYRIGRIPKKRPPEATMKTKNELKCKQSDLDSERIKATDNDWKMLNGKVGCLGHV